MRNETNLVNHAINDPVAAYGTPARLLLDTRLGKPEKLKILISWELDQRRLLTSESENMQAPIGQQPPSRAGEMLRAVQAALRDLASLPD